MNNYKHKCCSTIVVHNTQTKSTVHNQHGEQTEPKSENSDYSDGSSLIQETKLNPILSDEREQLNKFPAEIYDNLPPLLKDLTSTIDDQISRDLCLFSGIIFSSSLFPNIYAEYGGDEHYANLFGMVIAPSSTGKSHIRIGEYLVKSEVEQKRQAFLTELEEYNLLPDKEKRSKPREKTLIISANASDTALINNLENNDGLGIIYTTEMDSQACQEWANLSPIFRMMFDHQMVSRSRKDGNVYIQEPKCSILYSGTPNQFNKIIDDFETGLHQRFLMYTFDRELKWNDPFTKPYNLQKLGIEAYENHLSHLLKITKDKKIKFSLTESQKKKFNDYFRENLEYIKGLKKDNLQSILTRGGNITQRIAMILSILRITKPSANNLLCEDRDLLTAIKIFDTCYRHSIFIAAASRIQKCPDHLKIALSLFEGKEGDISTSELITEAGDKLPKSTLLDHLKQLIIRGYIVKVRQGIYRKVNQDKAELSEKSE